MEFISRTLFECPPRCIVQVPDVVGLFVVISHEDNGDVVLKPLRGAMYNFLANQPHGGIVSMRCTLDTTVDLLQLDDTMQIDSLNLFDF